MFGLLVVYLIHLAPQMHFQYFGHALHIATSFTHLCYPCHALIYTLFLHLSMSWLLYALYHFVLSFIWSSFSHSSCTPHASLSLFILSSLALISLALCLFMSKRRRVYSKVVYRRVLSFLYDSYAHPYGKKFYFLCTFVEGKIFHRRDAYTKGEKTLC